MKQILTHNSTTTQAKLFTALLLTGVLSVGNGMTIAESASAIPIKETSQISNPVNLRGRTRTLPRQVTKAIFQDISRQQGILASNLDIVEYTQKNWRNGCLELPKSDEFCTQALVPGWRVVATDGKQNWVYHTNNNGRSLRLASGNKGNSGGSKVEKLPQSVKNAVFKAATKRLGILPTNINIIQAESRNWSDGCLGLGDINQLCSQAIVPGWRVVVGAQDEALVYHVNATGSTLRLNEQESQTKAKDLPDRVSAAIIKKASEISGSPQSAIAIINHQRHSWSNYSDSQKINGWEVTVSDQVTNWTYWSDETGSKLQLSAKGLPQKVMSTVLSQVSEESGLPKKALNLVSYKRKEWNLGCENVPAGALCKPLNISGWEVTLQPDNGGKTWVYLSDNNGSRLESVAVGNLPKSLVDAVLADAQQRTSAKIKLSRKNIISAQKVQWNSLCLGLEGNCAQVIVDGWKITVAAGRDRLIYHTDSKSTAKLNIAASKINGNVAKVDAVKIPSNQLPPNLTDGVIFRQISSGGFAGRTYQTLLLNDGRLIQTREGDMNDSERRIYRVSTEEVQKFQKLLAQRDKKFQNLNYPAPRGAADYITYTLTSGNGTVQFNDISRESLPGSIQAVVKTWNSLNDTVKQQATGN